MNPRLRILLALALAATPSQAFADMVWPALYLEIRLLSWWAIASGLLAEYLFVRWIFRLSPWPALAATAGANAASTILGIVLIPLSGIAWELFPGSIYMSLLNWGTFNPATWAATFALACFVNTALEAFVYRRVFKLVVRRREFSWLVLANAFSVGLAFASLFIAPLET